MMYIITMLYGHMIIHAENLEFAIGKVKIWMKECNKTDKFKVKFTDEEIVNFTIKENDLVDSISFPDVAVCLVDTSYSK